jgi:hypothetical protein
LGKRWGKDGFQTNYNFREKHGASSLWVIAVEMPVNKGVTLAGLLRKIFLAESKMGSVSC